MLPLLFTRYRTTYMTIHRRQLKDDDFIKIVNKAPGAYTLNDVKDLFANTKSTPAPYRPVDEFTVPKKYRTKDAEVPFHTGDTNWPVFYAPNWHVIESTTIGRLLANTVLFSKSKALRTNVPYFNEAFNSKVIDKIEQLLADLFVAKKIEYEDWAYATDALQRLGFGPTAFLSPSMTSATIQLPPKSKILKKKLIAENKAALDQQDIAVTSRIEKEIIAHAVEENKDDPGMLIYASGARGSLGRICRTRCSV